MCVRVCVSVCGQRYPMYCADPTSPACRPSPPHAVPISDDLTALQEFAASVEDPDEVVDAAAGATATDVTEAVLVDQM